MAGITRVHITDTITGRGACRFERSREMWLVANKLYREIFEFVGMPLAEGYEELECSKDEYAAGYDSDLGVDIILEFETGQTATMQEKFLFTPFKTVTVEYYQDPRLGIKGDWFTMKCQYYFVGYDYPNTGTRFSTWVLTDWPRVQLATAQGLIAWKRKPNTRDGAKADFMYTPIKTLPPDVVIATSKIAVQQAQFVTMYVEPDSRRGYTW